MPPPRRGTSSLSHRRTRLSLPNEYCRKSSTMKTKAVSSQHIPDGCLVHVISQNKYNWSCCVWGSRDSHYEEHGFGAITLCSSETARRFVGGDMLLRNIWVSPNYNERRRHSLQLKSCSQVPHSVKRLLAFCCATTDLHVGIASESRHMAETRQQCCQLHLHVPV